MMHKEFDSTIQPQLPTWLLITSLLMIVAFAIGMIWAFLTIKPWN